MKGLLLKDWYMLKKYCRSYLFVLVIFAAVSMVNTENTFFIIYPMVLLGLLPVTLIAHDERSKWDVYCGALPITRDQQVTGKYLLILILAGAGLVFTVLVQFAQLFQGGSFEAQEFLLMESTLISFGLVCPSVMLPLIYKYGSEKGRMMYFIVIIVVCALVFSLDALLEEGVVFLIRLQYMSSLPLLVVGVSLAVLWVSWRLSMKIYRKREL